MAASTKKIINAWAMYDWANSAYNLVITSTIFPIYYSAITMQQVHGQLLDEVVFMGMRFKSGELYNYALSVAYLIVCMLSPVLSSIADSRGNKKFFMKVFTYLGALGCASLYFFTNMDTLPIGIGGMMLGAIGFCGSVVFYNAYLPEIVPPKLHNLVSAKGFAYGYLGSVLLQLFCFYLVLFSPWGITEKLASQISFVLVALWWVLFAQIPFAYLPKDRPLVGSKSGNVLTAGFKELRKVWQQIKTMQSLKRYLTAFFFYSMGVQTVMLAATIFGAQVIKLSVEKLILCILIIQLLALLGAFLVAKLASAMGDIVVLLLLVVWWISICVAAYYCTTELHFFIIAFFVGLVMGGIQSLSRAVYAKMIPLHDTASFFSFYDVTEKMAIVLGMASFAYMQDLTGNMRNAIFLLTFFFLAGFISLLWAKMTKEKEEKVCR